MAIKPAAGMKEELIEMISGLSPAECCAAIRKNEIIGALILNVLPTLQVAQILNLLTSQEVERITTLGANFDREALAARQEEMAMVVQQVVSSHRKEASPFVERIPQLIKEADSQKELFLFQRLVEAVPRNQAFDIVMDNFPMHLLFELPPEVINFSLEKWPISRRAELIVGLDKNTKEKVLSSLTSSKLREILDAEIEQINLVEGRYKKVMSDKEKTWRSFLNMTRDVLKTNNLYKSEAEQIANKWLDQFYRGRDGDVSAA